MFGIVQCLSTAIDAKDPYTCGHSERVARIAVRLGEVMNLSRGEISDLYLAGLLHDVGKIGIRDEVLCKPGPLTAEEEEHIREHPIIGERIISNVTRLAYLRPGVRGHHERFDGGGYPDGLAGEAIPPIARILAVADSCDAMMSARRYRPALAAGPDRGDLPRGLREAVGPAGSSGASSRAGTSSTRSASAVWASRCTWPSSVPPRRRGDRLRPAMAQPRDEPGRGDSCSFIRSATRSNAPRDRTGRWPGTARRRGGRPRR